MKKIFFCFVIFIYILIFGGSYSYSDLSVGINTISFINISDMGTYPNSLIFNRKNRLIIVDLFPLPKNLEIFRAILITHRRGNVVHWPFTKLSTKEIKIEPLDTPGHYLKLIPPRYNTFDCTDAVINAIKSGKHKLILKIVSFPGLADPAFATYIDKKTKKVVLRLDVTCNLKLKKKFDSVYDIKAYSKDGDTVITWRVPSPIFTSNNITGKEFQKSLYKANNPHEIRYRIYRSSVPITPSTILKAKLIDEIGPFSIWDPWYFSRWEKGEHHFFKSIVPRMPIANGILGNYDQGIYVYHCKKKDKAYYAVVKTVDGQEDFSSLKLGVNSLKDPVQETTGSGLVLLKKIIKHKGFHYIKNSTLYYFVKWEAPPNSNFPNIPFNYLVAVPSYKSKSGKRPVDVALHCWGDG